MSAAPGGVRWLLGHELRLAWYGAALNKGGKRRPGLRAMVVWGIGWILLHAFACAVLYRTGGMRLDGPETVIGATVLLAVCTTFMLSTALKASVMVLFERGDLDLLLSSPLPSRSIFAVRLLGVAATTAAAYLYLFAPFAHVALVLGYPGWLGIYVAVCACALLAACAAMLLTLALVRLLGARRTRVVAQIVAGIAGALIFLLSQLYNLVAHSNLGGMAGVVRKLTAARWLGPDSPVWLPGRAALGAPLPLLAAVLMGGLAYTLTVGRTHRFFVHGLQQAAGSVRVRARPAGPLQLRFRASLFDTIVIKEWRLIARDPHLISQVLLQLLYLLPLLFLIVRGDTAGPAIGAGLTLLCSSLTASLAWIVISAEEAPDLLLAAPAALRTVRLAKLAAATMPSLLLVALPLLWLLVRAPLAGLLTAFTTVAAVLSAGLIVSWTGRPAPRSNFKMRGKENFLCTMLELASSLCWGALSWLLALLVGAAGPDAGTRMVLLGCTVACAGGLGLPCLAWLLRRRHL